MTGHYDSWSVNSHPMTGSPGRIVITPWHSRVVVGLRIMLPILMLLLIAALYVWIKQNQSVNPLEKASLAHHEVVNGRFFGFTQNGQPMSIFFKKATQSVADSTLIEIAEPYAEVSQNTDQWITIKAKRGEYHQDTGKLVLYDDIHFIRNDGTELHTNHADIDTIEGSILGKMRVQGQTIHDEIDARGFYISDFGTKVIFFDSPAISLIKKKRPRTVKE